MILNCEKSIYYLVVIILIHFDHQIHLCSPPTFCTIVYDLFWQILFVLIAISPSFSGGRGWKGKAVTPSSPWWNWSLKSKRISRHQRTYQRFYSICDVLSHIFVLRMSLLRSWGRQCGTTFFLENISQQRNRTGCTCRHIVKRAPSGIFIALRVALSIPQNLPYLFTKLDGEK